jgi:hypothetical protein
LEIYQLARGLIRPPGGGLSGLVLEVTAPTQEQAREDVEMGFLEESRGRAGKRRRALAW